ncbi:MAG TPA: hypothetical protein VGC28_06385 [Sphingomonas sp.]
MPFPRETNVPIALDQQATLIDLDGTAPLTAPLSECVRHFMALKASAKADHRILLTQPVPRKDRPTRTWILNPDDIEMLAAEAQG